MKRLIYAMICVPAAGCLANSTPVGDIDDTSGGEVVETETGTGPGSMDSELGSTTDPDTGTDTDDMDTTGPGEGGSSSGGETSGGGVSEDALDPIACLDADNAGDGAISLDLGDWPLGDIFEPLEGTCTISAIDTSGGAVGTTLECFAETTGPHIVEIVVGEPPAGSLAWAVDDSVEVEVQLDDGKGGHFAQPQAGIILGGPPVPGGAGPSGFVHYSVAMRDTDDGSLLLASTTQQLGSQLLAPLQVEAVEGCLDDSGCGSDNPEVRLQHLIAEPGGESVVVTGGQRITLPLEDGSIVMFDARRAHAIESDCHFFSTSVAALRLNP